MSKYDRIILLVAGQFRSSLGSERSITPEGLDRTASLLHCAMQTFARFVSGGRLWSKWSYCSSLESRECVLQPVNFFCRQKEALSGSVTYARNFPDAPSCDAPFASLPRFNRGLFYQATFELELCAFGLLDIDGEAYVCIKSV